MTRSPLRCLTSIIRSSALVQASSSLFRVTLALGHGGHFIQNSISAIFLREFFSEHFAKLIWYKQCLFSTRAFPQNFTWCHAMVAKSLFSRQKMERTYWFYKKTKNCFYGFESKRIESFNTRFWSSRLDHGERYFKNWIFQVLRDSFHESILLVKAY